MSKVSILLLKIGMDCANLGDVLSTYLDDDTTLETSNALIDFGFYLKTKAKRSSLSAISIPQTLPLIKNYHSNKDIYDNIQKEWETLELNDLILDFSVIHNIRYVVEHSLREIDLNTYDIIGLSCIDNSMLTAIICMNYIRGHSPDKKIIVGGAFPHFNQSFMDILVNEKLMDTYVIGDGELALPTLVKLYKSGTSFPGSIEMPIDNLNDIPQRTVYDNDGYLFSSRSCPHNCSFCQPRNYGKYRTVDPSFLADSINYINIKHNVKHFYIHDNVFNKSKQYVLDFHDEIKKIDLLGEISIWTTLRPHNIDEDVLEALSDLNCSFSVGIESFSQPVLDLMNKKSDSLFLLQLLGYLEKYDGIVFLHNLFGFPGETLKMFHESLRVFLKTSLPVMNRKMNFFTLTKDSSIHLHPDDYNIELVPFPESVNDYFPEVRMVLNEIPMKYIDLKDPNNKDFETKLSVRRIVNPVFKKK